MKKSPISLIKTPALFVLYLFCAGSVHGMQYEPGHILYFNQDGLRNILADILCQSVKLKRFRFADLEEAKKTYCAISLTCRIFKALLDKKRIPTKFRPKFLKTITPQLEKTLTEFFWSAVHEEDWVSHKLFEGSGVQRVTHLRSYLAGCRIMKRKKDGFPLVSNPNYTVKEYLKELHDEALWQNCLFIKTETANISELGMIFYIWRDENNSQGKRLYKEIAQMLEAFYDPNRLDKYGNSPVTYALANEDISADLINLLNSYAKPNDHKKIDDARLQSMRFSMTLNGSLPRPEDMAAGDLEFSRQTKPRAIKRTIADRDIKSESKPQAETNQPESSTKKIKSNKQKKCIIQ